MALLTGLAGGQFASRMRAGRQTDGTFVVSTGQSVPAGTIAFDHRPVDMALHPGGELFAVLTQRSVFLATRAGMVEGSRVPTRAHASYRGCLWTPNGQALYVSLGLGSLQRFRLEGRRLVPEALIPLNPPGELGNPVPGGMAVNRAGTRLYVACADRGGVVELELPSHRRVREWRAQNVPFDARLSPDEGTLFVSNWAGRPARREEDEEEAESGAVRIAVDRRGVAASGTVSLIDLRSGRRRDVPVGLHPAGMSVKEDKVYVANAGSDTVSEIDVGQGQVTRTIPIHRSTSRLFGSMPNALTVRGDRLYVACGGDNAICEIDLNTGVVAGFRPAGFFPVAVRVTADGKTAYVVNSKGNGSVARTVRGLPGGVHHFQGTVSVINLAQDLRRSTRQALAYARAYRLARPISPNLKVYRGAIKHVLYVIKENRTYDQVLGDIPKGNGQSRLCLFGEEVTPNHHALANEFALLDNAYASGTNSADGHQWAMEGLANDYVERFYSDYPRGYPFDGGDAMAYAGSGFIWDAAVQSGLSVRVYGEFCKARLADIRPRPRDWMEAWQDRATGANRIKVRAKTTVAGLKKLIHPNVIGWPLLMSDQWRADRFLEEYRRLSKADRVPNLMILTLPADHTEALRPGYPTPRSMMADNDLALGRVVEAVSRSPQWKETCIIVMEDDAQFGLDHVDGHRTVCLVASPYVKRGAVDSTFYTQVSVLRSIELMLGLKPMNRFDATATPFGPLFTDAPDLRPFVARPNKHPLDRMNPGLGALSGARLHWAKRSEALDWEDVDTAEWDAMNRILWYDARGDAPYPSGG